jgi:Fe-S cluster biosynthesis and repair protein YggX
MKTIEIYQDAVLIGRIKVADSADIQIYPDEIIEQVNQAVGEEAWNRTEEIKT